MYDLRDPWNNRLCCVGAAAAVAATVATVAAVGMQVAKSAGAFGKEGGGGGGAASAAALAPGAREAMFARGTQDILNTERAVLDDALAQGKLLEPEMYAALGLKPIYDRDEDPEIAGLSNELNDKEAFFNESRARLQELKNARGQLKGAKNAGARKALKKDIKRLKRAAGPHAQMELSSLRAEVERRSAVGRRVIGFEALDGVVDPTGSEGGAFGGALNEFNKHLSAALAGKEPLDPTLTRSFEDKERVLRERLRRQMGPDYETSTAGAQAIANFDRERAEAFSQYNRESITGFSNLAESRATALQNLTSGRLKNLAFPATFRSSLAEQLEGAAAARTDVTRADQTERGLKSGAAGRAAAERSAAAAATREQRADALAQILSGVSSAASTVGSYGTTPAV